MPNGSRAPALTHLSLFSGIGGADLAAEWAGIKTIAHAEIEPHCTEVLKKNFPGIPNLGDITKITKEVLERETGYRTVDVISGGYPCQPFSTAGQRRGKTDDRYLWPAMLEAIESIRPPWVVGENVAGHITLGLDETLSDLERAGYTARPFVIPACATGALHRRDRVFVVAHDNGRRLVDVSFEELRGTSRLTLGIEPSSGGSVEHVPSSDGIGCDSGCDHREKRHLRDGTAGNTEEDHTKRSERLSRSCATCQALADSCGIGLEEDEGIWRESFPEDCRYCGNLRDGHYWLFEPRLGRMVDGVPTRMDKARIKALGNAIVPQQIYPVFEAIALIERVVTDT